MYAEKAVQLQVFLKFVKQLVFPKFLVLPGMYYIRIADSNNCITVIIQLLEAGGMRYTYDRQYIESNEVTVEECIDIVKNTHYHAPNGYSDYGKKQKRKVLR